MRGDPRRGKDIFWVSKVEGRETHILLAKEPKEMKLINFGSLKVEGEKINTALGY